MLPWAAQLESALALLRETLRSPVEYESTPVIAALMQARQIVLPMAHLPGNENVNTHCARQLSHEYFRAFCPTYPSLHPAVLKRSFVL